jgi:hypothetical protein
MNKIVLGKSQEGKTVEIDLKILLRTRFLVQAASGGGKSQTLRRLAEQFFGKVPVWIIDRNDEFPSLRDKFGYVFAGPGGETPIDPRTAELVCEKLLKAKAPAIFGLYTLKDPDRHLWVKIFLEALMNVPKSLWTNLIVMIDEAHKLCPEKGQGESVAKEVVTDRRVLHPASREAVEECLRRASQPHGREDDRGSGRGPRGRPHVGPTP